MRVLAFFLSLSFFGCSVWQPFLHKPQTNCAFTFTNEKVDADVRSVIKDAVCQLPSEKGSMLVVQASKAIVYEQSLYFVDIAYSKSRGNCVGVRLLLLEGWSKKRAHRVASNITMNIGANEGRCPTTSGVFTSNGWCTWVNGSLVELKPELIKSMANAFAGFGSPNDLCDVAFWPISKNWPEG